MTRTPSEPCVACDTADCAHLIVRLGHDLWDDIERFADEDSTTSSAIVRDAVRQYATTRNQATTPAHNHYGGNVCGRLCPAWKAS